MFPIEVKGLSFGYDSPLLQGVTLNIEKGKFYGFIGPNGSGKSTLLKLIARQITDKTAARLIYINGDKQSDIPQKQLAKQLSIVNQNNSYLFDFTLEDIVLMGRLPHAPRFGNVSAADASIAEAAMQTTGILHLRDRAMNRVSGGEFQRGLLARAIAQEADIMLLDEPVSQLDIKYQFDIMQTIRRLSADEGKTVIIVLHDLNMAAEYCDELVLLHNGKIAATGRPKTVITRENVERVYELSANIVENPLTKRPFILHYSRG